MERLATLMPQWEARLREWATDGRLIAAATEALSLLAAPEPSKALLAFSSRLAAGDSSGLPPVRLLAGSAMPSARGAYAKSRGTIYLNAAWLASAGDQEVLSVLTEELGHHLDGLLNASDTPGDEGELFAALLHSDGVSVGQRQALRAEDDWGSVWAQGQELAVEQSAMLETAPIRQTRPYRTAVEVRNQAAFAALRSDGSVVTWGDPDYGGDSSMVASQLRSGVTQIFSSEYAFAALKADGSVVTWGDPGYGGDSTAVADRLASGVAGIFSNDNAFAALKRDGSVVTWGYPALGGDSSKEASRLASGVTRIFSTTNAFAALKSDGSVVTWGISTTGGDSRSVDNSLASGVSEVLPNWAAFAALKTDGSVITWGASSHGGDSRAVASRLASGVTQIFASNSAFAALKRDGSVVTWGDSSSGGNSSTVASRLASGVKQIVSSGYEDEGAFAALKTDGSVVTWGDGRIGGDSRAEASRLSSGVAQIFSNWGAFAALKTDGSVITWGNSSSGGDSSTEASRLASDVSQIFTTGSAFAALKRDGSVVTWGDSSSGGNSSTVASHLASGVSQIFTTDSAFAALKRDGSVVTWGDSMFGGDSTLVANKLNGEVVSFANPFTDDRLVSAPPRPTITLAVTPSTVTEDGATNLLYTFSRTGPTSSPLSVNYTVGGTATLGSDYTGIAASPATKTISFAAGSSTASLTVDPTADLSQEANETIALTLATSTGYTIGTTAAVIGTIRNDDIIGSSGANTLVGTSINEYLFGGGGNDTLQGAAGRDRLDGGSGSDAITGGPDADTFLFRFSQSRLATPDRLTDFAIGSDKIDLLSASGTTLPAPSAFSRASNSRATSLASLVSTVFTDANGATAGNQALATNSAALVVATAPAIAGTWLVINDSVAGFQSTNDLVVNLSGFTGTRPGLGSIAVGTWFV